MAGLGSLRQEEAGESQQVEATEPMAHDMMEHGGGEEGGESQPNVSPEEQAAYEQVVRNALRIIYPENADGKAAPTVLKALKAGDNPILALANAAVTIVTTLRESAKQAGRQLDPEILFHAGAEIVEELAELAEAAKVHDFSEAEIENAFYAALDMYRSGAEQTGDIDREGLMQGFEELKAADNEGRLGDVLPGLPGGAEMEAR